jgi:hypothetical protein
LADIKQHVREFHRKNPIEILIIGISHFEEMDYCVVARPHWNADAASATMLKSDSHNSFHFN